MKKLDPQFFGKKFIKSKKKFFGTKNLKNPKTKSKNHLYFIEYYIAAFLFEVVFQIPVSQIPVSLANIKLPP